MVAAHYVDPRYHSLALGRLYLPESWCEDPERREAAQVPAGITFQKAGDCTGLD